MGNSTHILRWPSTVITITLSSNTVMPVAKKVRREVRVVTMEINEMSATSSTYKNSGTVLILQTGSGIEESHIHLFQSWGLKVKTYSCCDELLSSKPPDVPVCLITRITGNERCGIGCCEELKQAGWNCPIIFVINNSDVPLAVLAMRAGAEDIISLPADENQMMDVVFRTLDKSKTLAGICDDYMALIQRAALLTAREREIVSLVAAGKLNKEIADLLGLALVTVKVHRGSAMHKLGARTPADLARIAQAAGIWVRTNAPLPTRKAKTY